MVWGEGGHGNPELQLDSDEVSSASGKILKVGGIHGEGFAAITQYANDLAVTSPDMTHSAYAFGCEAFALLADAAARRTADVQAALRDYQGAQQDWEEQSGRSLLA